MRVFWQIGHSATTTNDTVESTTSSTAPYDKVGYYVVPICSRCGNNHPLENCPQVKAIEYHENGKIKRVEFHPSPPVLPQEITVTWRNPLDPPWTIT